MPGPGRPRAKPGAKVVVPASRSTRHASQGARAARPAGGAAGAARKPARTARKPAFRVPDAARVVAVVETLRAEYPDARTALDFQTPLQLLIATILSAQCTDERVNQVTPGLFARFPDAAALAAADRAELETLIKSTGFFRNKAKAILSCCADLVKLHGGEVPRTLEQLTALHGVGRKTANVVLANAFGIPGIAVDTHVTRVSNRLAFVRDVDAVKIEFALMQIVPREHWLKLSHYLILHGRRICVARKPRCSVCPVAAHCPRVGVTVHA